MRMARRSVRIRVDAGVENPWERQEFRHDPLLEWVGQHRGELIWAALVLVANWIARGAQPFTERTLGSFEVWARAIGGVLNDAGIEGFLQGRQQMQSEVDRDSASWTAFFEAWWQKYGRQPMTAGELMAIAEDLLSEVVGSGSDRSRATRLVSRLAVGGAASLQALDFKKSGLPIISRASGQLGG
jgi:putative DNA primase/helicase